MEAKIRSIVQEILDAITDPKLKKLVEERTFLTGGCFKAIYHGQEVNDFDFYFYRKEDAQKFEKLVNDGLKKPRTKAFTNIKKFYLEDIKHKSQFAITFMLNEKFKVQFITKYSGTPEAVTSNFDFQHCKNYYIPMLDVFNINKTVLANKELIFNEKASHPINAIKRMQKFIQQGWRIDDIQIMKIAEAISKLDLNDDKVYLEQGSGMYLYQESTMRGYNSRRNVG